jgi:Kef-type K+ transport system membrane component KefB
VTASAVGTLVLIALASVVAPLLSELTGRLAIPEIVFQIVLGILLGPYVLNLAHLDSGIEFDAHVFVQNPSSMWRVPLFLALMLLARGAPVYLFYRKDLTRPQRLPMALFSATGLPLIVVITSIAVAEHRMREVNAASLVAAGILSVLLFPALGLWRLKSSGTVSAPQDSPAS